jgi:acyl-CoA thioesterase-1
MIGTMTLKRILSPTLLSILAVGMLSACSTQRSRSYIRESDYPAPIRVACVGDSITYGHRIKDREHDSYPAQLGVLLGDKWTVRNFGVNGATAFKEGGKPYSLQPAYQDALAFRPDVVIIKLGTNDTNPADWSRLKKKFTSDYRELIRSFQALNTRPRIYLCLPVPLFRDRGKAYDTDKILTEEIIPQINKIASDQSLPVIDLYVAMASRSELFPDGVHPNATGARIMATTIYTKLTGRQATQPPSK